MGIIKLQEVCRKPKEDYFILNCIFENIQTPISLVFPLKIQGETSSTMDKWDTGVYEYNRMSLRYTFITKFS